MKKKILSLALTLALSLTLILPAFAAQTYMPSWLEAGVTLKNAPAFEDPLTPVVKDDKWGYANRLGKLCIAPQYDYALAFTEDLAGVSKDGKGGFINFGVR